MEIQKAVEILGLYLLHGEILCEQDFRQAIQMVLHYAKLLNLLTSDAIKEVLDDVSLLK